MSAAIFVSPARHLRWLLAVGLLGLLPTAGRAESAVEPPAKYAAAVRELDAFVARVVADRQLPALSVALVDDQQIVWAKGFGLAKPDPKVPATADTVYRVGSVSKLFTDIAVMQLVEVGKLDLDAPVTKYLPDFKPGNPFQGKIEPITLRHLMAHRSGLVRESPVGNYFDDTRPPLADMVASLNGTELVYPPGSRIKYSNAAVATVGFVLQQTQKQPFAPYLQKHVLDPLGMTHSGFEPTPALTKDLAAAVMWTYHGRTFPAPTFELSMAPAGCMYATVTDLARFESALFAGGKGANGRVLKEESIRQMLTPQFAKADEKTGFGIGFVLGQLDGRRRVGHGGAIYGFSTELAFLPDDKLGAVVVTSKDVANAQTERLADAALRQLLAAKSGKPLPKIEETTPLPAGRANALAGRYRSGDKAFDLIASAGRLYAWSAKGGFRVEVRAAGDALLTDDATGFGQKMVPDGDNKLRLGGDVYERVAVPLPAAPPERWRGLIGEYGWDHNVLTVLEKDGKLHALIEWFFLYPLAEESADVFKFPDSGLYHGEKLKFRREKDGRASAVTAASVVFKRRRIDGEDGETFRIKPQRPLAELRKEALAAKPPAEKGDFRKPDLVELTALDPTIKLEIRYATDNNFLSVPFYTSAKAFMQRPAAAALLKVHQKLAGQGYGLLVFDAYRPWYVTKMFWEATPPKQRLFVADPAQGSRHNRGCAVDLTLYDLKTGQAVAMVSGYDEMSDRAYPDYPGGTSRQRWHRELLRRAMEEGGFTVYEAEWWHYDFKDWRKYPIFNARFEELAKPKAD